MHKMATLGNSLAVFQNAKDRVTIWHSLSTQEKWKHMSKNPQKTKNPPQTYMFLAALFLTAKKVEKSRYLSTDTGINKVGDTCMWNLI